MYSLRIISTEQILYLPFIEPTENNLASGTLAGCDDCTSSEISLPEGFPFGGYFHQSVYVIPTLATIELMYIHTHR